MSADASHCKSLLDRYEDAFAALHYMIESFQRKEEIPRGQKARVERDCLIRARTLVTEEIDALNMEEGMTIDEVVLRVARKLAEDFLLRVDPILNPEDEDGD